MTRRRLTVLRFCIPVLAIVGLIAGIGLVVNDKGSASSPSAGKSSHAKQQHVTVMLDWTPNTNHSGIYLAKQRGYYDKANLDVSILQPGQQGALPALGSGNVDFAITVQESLIPARAQGVPAVSVGAILSTNTSSLMSLASAGITRPRDLEGKTYGGFGGQLERQLIDSLVRCDGGDPSKVKFVDVGNANYRVGLEDHQYDVVWVFDGWDVISLRQQGVALNTIPFASHLDCIPDWYTPLIATTEQKIAKDPALVRDFMSATAHGYQDAIADPPAAANALLVAAPELDANLVRESSTYLAKFYAKPGQPWGVQDTATWTRFAQFLQTSGLVDKPVDVKRSFTNQFLAHDLPTSPPKM